MKEHQLGAALSELLSGQNLKDKQGEAMMLLTTDEDGWPHVAMISVGEIAALEDGSLRIGLWPGTATSSNIRRTGKATLAVFYSGSAHYVRLALSPLTASSESAYPRDRYAAEVVAAKEDKAKYADIISGVTIRLKEPEEVIARWQETVRDLKDDSVRDS